MRGFHSSHVLLHAGVFHLLESSIPMGIFINIGNVFLPANLQPLDIWKICKDRLRLVPAGAGATEEAFNMNSRPGRHLLPNAFNFIKGTGFHFSSAKPQEVAPFLEIHITNGKRGSPPGDAVQRQIFQVVRNVMNYVFKSLHGLILQFIQIITDGLSNAGRKQEGYAVSDGFKFVRQCHIRRKFKFFRQRLQCKCLCR